MQQTTRPLNQHRPSLSSASSSGLTTRQPHSRTNSHSILSGALNANHRVTRRKSMTNTAANAAAMAAAIREVGGDKVTPIAVSSRRNTASKSAAARAAIVGSLPSPPASLPTQKFHLDGKMDVNENAIEDEPNNASGDEGENNTQKARMRRASDGQPLVKEGSRKFNRVELKCETCGKGYKHSSCLTKHLFVPFPIPRIPVLQFLSRVSRSERRTWYHQCSNRASVDSFSGQVGTHSRVVFDFQAPHL